MVVKTDGLTYLGSEDTKYLFDMGGGIDVCGEVKTTLAHKI